MTIFKLKLMLVVGEYLSVGPSKMKGAADQAELEAKKRPSCLQGQREQPSRERWQMTGGCGQSHGARRRALPSMSWVPQRSRTAAGISCVVAKTAAKDLLCSGLRYAMKD